MKELIELRVSPEIKQYLPEDICNLAKQIGSISIIDVYLFELPSHDERWKVITDACEKLEEKRLKQPPDPRFNDFKQILNLLTEDTLRKGWTVHPLHGYSWVGAKRFYTQKELLAAKALQIIPYVMTQFTRKIEDRDLIYDISSKCKMCGIAIQKSDLIFESPKFPKSKDIIGLVGFNEVIVSKRFAEILETSNIQGIIIKDIFLRKRSKLYPIDEWKQMVVTSEVRVSDLTIFGYDIFHPDKTGVGRCKVCGLTRGQGIQSELHIDGNTWAVNDIAVTRERVGGGTTIGSPLQMMVISPRLYKLMKENDIKGYHVEVTHVI
jgi:hypothetical protein